MRTVQARSRDDHLFGPGPKRILSLDGGGVRGVLSLAYLEKLEAMLRARFGGNPSFRLCDYFDLIGGTSTGSIIAAGLALGFSASEMLNLYQGLSGEVFRKPIWSFGIFGAKFGVKPLESALRTKFGDHTLGSDAVRTGLAMVTKRVDTGSPWIVSNNPRGRYFRAPPDEPAASPNADILIRELVRASTAAPTFFEPEFLEVAHGITGAFVDGGVSPHNNPALLLLMVATIAEYAYGWPVGEDRLLLTSIGTGHCPTGRFHLDLRRTPSAVLAVMALNSMIEDSSWHAQAVLQWLSATPTPWRIDSEVGDLSRGAAVRPKLLSYLRYNVTLETDWMERHLGITLPDQDLRHLHRMDAPGNIAQMLAIGRKAAEVQLRPEHFPAAFDP